MSLPELPIILSVEARDDLIEISLYGLASRGEDIANRYAADLQDALRHIARFPGLGRVKEGEAANVRVLRHDQHVIYYEAHSDSIVILRVLHTRMDATHYLDF